MFKALKMQKFDDLQQYPPPHPRCCLCVRKISRHKLITAVLSYQSEQIFVADDYTVTARFTGFDRLKSRILLTQNEKLQRKDRLPMKAVTQDVYR